MYKLNQNAGLSFQGSITLGMGFILTPEERDALVVKDPRNAERIFPYLGGKEVNTSPTQDHHRYVISFGSMSLKEAEAWPNLLAIVREKVKPDRDRLPSKNNWNRTVRKNWWQFGSLRENLYAAIAPLNRCLVTLFTTKHMTFSFASTETVFANTLYAFPLENHAPFAILQSRIHERWARRFSSSMKTDLRYSASDCFETFPFPAAYPGSVLPLLEAFGAELYETRAGLMARLNIGLTELYNKLKDPELSLHEEDAPDLFALRAAHEQLDRHVLEAYALATGDPSWTDIDIPPFTTPRTDLEKYTHNLFEEHILCHLFALNQIRRE